MVSFNNSIKIRNHAGDPVKSTARLIETLQKVGIIKTKKRRAKRGLATEQIRQNNDMGPGYAVSRPMQGGQAPLLLQGGQAPLLLQGGQAPLLLQNAPQGGFNQAQIEDIQRTYSQQIGLLQDQVQRQSEQQNILKLMGYALGGELSNLQQRIDRPVYGVPDRPDPFKGVKGNNDDVESSSEEIIDSDDQELTNIGGNNVPQSVQDVETSKAGAGFVEEEEETTFQAPEPKEAPPAPAPAKATRKKESQKPIESFLNKSALNALREAEVFIPANASTDNLRVILSQYADKTRQVEPKVVPKKYPGGRTEPTADAIRRAIYDLIKQELIKQRVQETADY